MKVLNYLSKKKLAENPCSKTHGKKGLKEWKINELKKREKCTVMGKISTYSRSNKIPRVNQRL